MQARVPFVGVVRILHQARIIADDALHKRKVVEYNGATEARRYVDPAAVCKSFTN